jgi:predicted ATPase
MPCSLGYPPLLVKDRPYLVSAASRPEFREVFDRLANMRFYDVHPHAVQEVENYEADQVLSPHGENLASVLARLARQAPEVKERIDEYLRGILPGFIEVRPEPVQSNGSRLPTDVLKVALVFVQKTGTGVHLFWASQMSAGTLKALGIVTALGEATTDKARLPLVAIEEPEAQIHPAVVGVLLDAMTAASYSTQVLIATQSSDLLDDKHVKTETLLAVEARDGQTTIGPIEEASRSVIRERLYTVGELLRIGQIAPELPTSPEAAPSATAPAEDKV